MAGVSFLMVMIAGALILAKIGRAIGCGPTGVGCLILLGLALLITWLESAGIFS